MSWNEVRRKVKKLGKQGGKGMIQLSRTCNIMRLGVKSDFLLACFASLQATGNWPFAMWRTI